MTTESERLRKGLEIILRMRSADGESLIDAQMIAAMTLHPEDYSSAVLISQGLLP